MKPVPGYVTTREAAPILGYRIDEMPYRIRRGDVKATKFGTGWYIAKADLEQLANVHHRHRWTGLIIERVGESGYREPHDQWYEWPTTVIQSCDCGEVRRVEVPE